MKIHVVFLPQATSELTHRLGANFRVDLWAKTKIDFDSEDPQFDLLQDEGSKQYYMEFETDQPNEITQLLEQGEYRNNVQVTMKPSEVVGQVN